jgi:hypothetical protein
MDKEHEESCALMQRVQLGRDGNGHFTFDWEAAKRVECTCTGFWRDAGGGVQQWVVFK